MKGVGHMKVAEETENVKKRHLGKVQRALEQYPSIAAILILVIIMSLLSDAFFTTGNLMNVLRQVSMTAIVAAGMSYVALGGEIDISVGSTVGLVNVMWAKLMVDMGMNPLLAVLLCLLAAAIVGAVNGFLVARVHINSLIATFAMQSILRGLVYIITNSYPIYNVPKSIFWLARGYVLKIIPIPVIITVIVFAVCWFVATYTKYGRSLYAVGGNREAAHLSGIRNERITIISFVVVQVCGALAAFILTARLNAGIPTSGNGWEFEAIIAAIIGGVSLAGGRGKVPGALLGAIFVGLLVNGMTLLNIDSYYQQVVKGVILIGAIWIDTYANSHKKTA
jgi:ribose transport system permease protein